MNIQQTPSTATKSELLKQFFPVIWASHLNLGLVYGILGPLQPYLASQVSVNHESISTIWSGRSVSVVLASILTPCILGFMRKKMKMVNLKFLISTQSLIALILLIIPFIRDYWVLLIVMVSLFFSVGAIDYGNNLLMAEMFGSVDSRPYIQALHAFVAVGFVLVSFLAPIFLPKEKEDICRTLSDAPFAGFSTSNGSSIELTPTDNTIPLSGWIFAIVASLHILTLMGFGILVCRNFSLPKYEANEESETNEETDHKGINLSEDSRIVLRSTYESYTILGFAFLYFLLFGGLDSFFQSQIFTFGLCGPFDLSAKEAGLLNSVFFGTYLIGRLVCVPLAKYLSPRNIVGLSLSGCFLSALFFSVVGRNHVIPFFVSTGLMGFFICFEFGCGLSWILSRIKEDMNSKATSVAFIGNNIGSFIFPPLSSFLFEMDKRNSQDFASVFYLTLVTTFIHLGIFLCIEIFQWRKQKRSRGGI